MNQLFSLNNATVIPLMLLMLLSGGFGLFIASLYKNTHRGISYSQGFVQTLVIIVPVGSVIFFFVSNNLATAIGLFGAFSLIRFRTAVKEVKDMIFLFWALATSLILAVGGFWAALISTIFIAAFLYALNTTDYGRKHTYEQIVTYQLDGSITDHQVASQAVYPYITGHQLLSAKTLRDGQLMEVAFGVKLKKNTTGDTVVKELLAQPGVKTATIITTKQQAEL